MADFGLLYRLRYETSKYKRDVKLDIEKKDYTGSGVMKRIGSNGVTLSKEKDDIIGKIRAKSLEFSIQSDIDSEYQNFFLYENGTYRVELKIDDQIVWVGLIICDQYTEPYIDPPYDVDILATDGLGLLKNYDFELTGIVSRFEAIRYCLEKVGLGIGYAFNIDLFETRMNQDKAMLDQLYFDGDIFGENGEDYNCYEALQALIPAGCIITQSGMRWLIQRESEPWKTRILYDADGTYEGTEQGESLQQLGKLKGIDTDIYPVGQLTDNREIAWSSFTIKNEYGKKESLLKNFDLSYGNISYWNSNIVPTSKTWTNPRTGETNTSIDYGYSVNQDGDDYYCLISGYEDVKYKSYVYQSIEIQKTSSSFVFSIDISILATVTLTTTFLFQVKLITSTTTYYLSQTDGWVEDMTYIEYSAKGSIGHSSISWNTLKVILSNIPNDGILTLYIYKCYGTSQPVNYRTGNFYGLAFTNAKIYTEELNALPDSSETTVEFDSTQSESGKTIDLLPCDLPDYANNSKFFANGNLIDINGEKKPTVSWIYDSKDPSNYNTYLAALYAQLFGIPKMLLTGTVRGENITLDSYFQHKYNNERQFYIRTGEWDVLNDQFTIEAVEILGSVVNHSVSDNTPDPTWGVITSSLIDSALAVFYRVYDEQLINKHGDNAIIEGDYIIFPILSTDIFNRSNSDYWSGLTIYDEDPHKWKLTELIADTLIGYGTSKLQSQLFLNDYLTSAVEILPIVVFSNPLTDDEKAEVTEYVINNKTTVDNGSVVELPTVVSTINEGIINTVDDYEVSVVFKNQFQSDAVIIPTLKVFRYRLYKGVYSIEDVLYYFTNIEWYNYKGFTIKIADSEDLSGVIVKYHFSVQQ